MDCFKCNALSKFAEVVTEDDGWSYVKTTYYCDCMSREYFQINLKESVEREDGTCRGSEMG